MNIRERILKMLKKVFTSLGKYDKTERSTFKYWLAHYCAYQYVALKYHCWRLKYIFHDIEKPWLRLFLPYQTVQKIHRKIHSHHPDNKLYIDIDFEGVIIDWECSRFTKTDSPYTAVEMVENYINEHKENHRKIYGENEQIIWLNIIRNLYFMSFITYQKSLDLTKEIHKISANYNERMYI